MRSIGKMTVRRLISVVVLAAALTGYAFAQEGTQPKKPAPPRRPIRVNVDKSTNAPQVVTIIHRLNGLKMFRLLLRSEERVKSIEALDSAFSLMNDVHINVIAGLAMDDGETIAAWLPEAEVEFGPVATADRTFFDEPDISVIGPDGKRLDAKYIGLDGATGLSILKLTDKNALPSSTVKERPVSAGENVVVFGPEPVTKARAFLGGNLYVRMGAIQGRIKNVVTAPSGEVAKFKISSPRLTHVNVGGVAVNDAGETIGIVDGLEGSEATILPAALIKRAAQRVLEQQASVPRPWLGVKGEAVSALKLDQILNHGWEMKRAAALAGKHRGIMLTSIVPGSPAARAALRAGDVILKVDDKEIENADDFTWWLDQAGPSSSVEFTVARPDHPTEEPLNVKLSGRLDPAFSFDLRNRDIMTNGFSLIDQGVETIALKLPVAVQLGTTAGLLVVYVEPQTPAFEAGLQPGDVIQSIDGKPVSDFKLVTQPAAFKFEVIRNKQKLIVTLPAKKK
jgi:serine protease Do